MTEFLKHRWGTLVGILTLAAVPFAFLDGVNRYTLLPQMGMAYAAVMIGFACWLAFGAVRPIQTSVVIGLAYLLVALLPAAWAGSPALSVVPVATEVVCVAVLVLVVVGMTRKDLEKTLAAGIVACGIVSVIGLLQYFGVGHRWVPTSGLPSATLGHRNIAAAYAAGTLPFIVWGFGRARDRWQVAGCAASGALTVAFIVATRSRGAWLSVLVSALLALWLFVRAGGRLALPREGFRTATVAIGLAVVVATSLYPAHIRKDVGEAMWHEKASVGATLMSVSASGGDKGRFDLWDSTLQMIRNRPIMGVGPGNWRIAYPVYAEGRMIDAQSVPHRPHNDLLTLWAENGFAALALFLALIFHSFRIGGRLTGPEDRAVGVAALAAVAACATNGLFSFPREFVASSVPMWFGFGVLAVLDAPSAREWRLRRWMAAAGLIVAACGLAVTLTAVRFDRMMVDARLADARSDWIGVLEATHSAGAYPGLDEQAWLLRGRALEQTGQPAQAIEAYRRGLDIHPHASGLWLGLGAAQQSTGDLDGARKSFERALEFDPQDGRVLSNLGTLSARAGDVSDAIDYYERAVSGESAPIEAYGNLSAALRLTGRTDRAIAVARQGLSLDRTPALANALGNALASANDHHLAVDAYADGLKRSPDHPQLLFNLARSYEALDRPGDAIMTYQKVLARLGDRHPDRRTFIEERIAALERGPVSLQ